MGWWWLGGQQYERWCRWRGWLGGSGWWSCRLGWLRFGWHRAAELNEQGLQGCKKWNGLPLSRVENAWIGGHVRSRYESVDHYCSALQMESRPDAGLVRRWGPKPSQIQAWTRIQSSSSLRAPRNGLKSPRSKWRLLYDLLRRASGGQKSRTKLRTYVLWWLLGKLPID